MTPMTAPTPPPNPLLVYGATASPRNMELFQYLLRLLCLPRAQSVGGSEEITLLLNSLRVPSHPRSTSLSLKLQMDVGVALRTRVACSAQDDIWSGPSGMAPGQHGRGKWNRKEATLRRPILTLQHALLVMSLVGGLVLVWLCNFRAQHHARSSVFKEATY